MYENKIYLKQMRQAINFYTYTHSVHNFRSSVVVHRLELKFFFVKTFLVYFSS